MKQNVLVILSEVIFDMFCAENLKLLYWLYIFASWPTGIYLTKFINAFFSCSRVQQWAHWLNKGVAPKTPSRNLSCLSKKIE